MTRGYVNDILQEVRPKNSALDENLFTPKGTIQYRLERYIDINNYTNTHALTGEKLQ